jgi:hypothetical protein
MTPLCKVEVTLPRVWGSGRCAVAVVSMSKQASQSVKMARRYGREGTCAGWPKARCGLFTSLKRLIFRSNADIFRSNSARNAPGCRIGLEIPATDEQVVFGENTAPPHTWPFHVLLSVPPESR